LKRGCCVPANPEPDTPDHYEIRGVSFKDARDEKGNTIAGGLEREHPWLAVEPVAKAIAMAEAVHDGPYVFTDAHFRTRAGGALDRAISAELAGDCVRGFIKWWNIHCNKVGRSHEVIPADPSGAITPIRFRRTMAMLTDQFPGSEIALGIQLKHIASRALANHTTQGYANADSSWEAHLESAIEAARFQRLEDLYQTHKTGKPIGYGPGAERMGHTFNDIQDRAQARGGDATVERALLRKALISIRFGPLNHCVMDENNPAGAACLEHAIVPEGHTGPLHDRCRPDRCANSVIGPQHVPIWASERRSLLTLIDTPGLSTCRKEALQRELGAVEAILDKTDTNKEQR
jgi:hypothetical protein